MCINQTIFKFQPKETTTVAQTSNDNTFYELPIFLLMKSHILHYEEKNTFSFVKNVDLPITVFRWEGVRVTMK